MTATAIELKDVFRVHSTPEGDAAALQGLSLRVADGEVLAVLGPSGSGKSTLLRLLAGLERPSAGLVRVYGEDVGKLPARGLARYRSSLLGYADQHYSRALAPELTARDLVAVQLGLRGTPRAERLRRADELLERVGLAEKRTRRPGQLSGGEQQRVALCAALAHAPAVFLADEPTGELDAATADQVYDVLSELVREHGCTTVIVSHDPESARIADRIVRIRDGRVSEEWSRESGDSDTIVVGRGGWLRLPEELLLRAGIGAKATARFEEGGVVVSPVGAAAQQVSDSVPVSDTTVSPGRLVVEARGLRKAYGATRVLAGVDVQLHAGLLHAVTGPSGSGRLPRRQWRLMCVGCPAGFTTAASERGWMTMAAPAGTSITPISENGSRCEETTAYVGVPPSGRTLVSANIPEARLANGRRGFRNQRVRLMAGWLLLWRKSDCTRSSSPGATSSAAETAELGGFGKGGAPAAGRIRTAARRPASGATPK